MSRFRLDHVGVRLVQEPPLYSNHPIQSPEDVVRLMAETFGKYDREVVAVVNFQKDMRPINVNIVSMGVLDYSLVHPREVLKSVILSNAAYTMLVHNHPSGTISPSKDDISITDRMSRLCNLIGIPLLDHVIVGSETAYYSFREKGELPLADIQYKTTIEDLQMGGMNVAENATIEKQKTMKVSFTVAECSEFHDAGEYHEDVKTVKEALAIFDKIPPERMHGIPSIGIRVTDEAEPELFTEVDILMGKRIDMDVLSYVPEIAENKGAQFAIAELIHRLPEAQVMGDIPESIQKKIQIIEGREKQSDQLQQITEQLEKGVADIFAGDKFKAFLDTMAKFPHYSVNNSILIMMQKPEASLCQSYTGWKSMGRYVKPGEKGIKILAPAPYTIQREKDAVNEKGQPILDADGEPVKESVEIRVMAFKVVSTFDVSQTEGKELPSIGVDELTGDVEGYVRMISALEEISPVPVSFEEILGEAKGCYYTAEKRIAIQEGMSEVQTLKTAIHEISHALLHDKDGELSDIKRSEKEVQAESVAYTVCKHFGIDTSDYSFGYVAGWSAGKEMPELKNSLDIIRKTAADLITNLEEKLEELAIQKPIAQEKNLVIQMKPDEKEAAGKLVDSDKPLKVTVEKKLVKSKREKKPSVRKQLKEEQAKEKEPKKPARKTKSKGDDERV